MSDTKAFRVFVQPKNDSRLESLEQLVVIANDPEDAVRVVAVVRNAAVVDITCNSEFKFTHGMIFK